MKKYIEIVAYGSDEVVKRLEVTGKSNREIERIDRGMNINLNHEDYYTREVSDDD